MDEDDNFYFLEVNTRLQVEHPITEMITGIDIVRKQLEIAAGIELTLRQEDIAGRGHAIECRVYAEDPENDFFPSPGMIEYLKEPSGPGVRNDCGVFSGFEAPVHYDPIISKLIVHAENREMAIARMLKALREYVLLGVKTPIPLLIDILESKPFQAGEVFTDFIPLHFSDWAPKDRELNAALIAYIVDEVMGRRRRPAAGGKERIPSPFQTLGNWRL